MHLFDQNNSPTGMQSVFAIVDRFNASWDEKPVPVIEFWNRLEGDRPLTLLSALVKADMQHRFERGERPTAAEYFSLLPQLVTDEDRVLSLVYEEFCLLEESHAEPRVSDFCDRYHPWRDSLISQLGYHRELSQIAGSARPKVAFPAVGDRFATYQLSSLLGTGGTAHVYRATDDLGGRQVVLKLSPSMGLEPSILARLEHRNIIPILTVAESPGSGLSGICMPYRPGMTLEEILKQFQTSKMPRKARAIAEILELAKWNEKAENSGWTDFPIAGTFTEAVAWLGVAMARALAYLHEAGVYHRDIKPANILLAHREGPLLFDFNLATCPNDPIHAQAALSGGTLPYMAPEQLRAFLDPAGWDSVGEAADLYALGLVLRELVTGLKPDLPRSDLPVTRAIQDLHDHRHELQSSIRTIQPDLPPSLDAIIRKCLEFRADQRYPHATELAEDLQSFLDRRPLIHLPNPSRLEWTANCGYRWRKPLAVVALLSLLFSYQYLTQPTVTDAMLHEGSVLLESSQPGAWKQAHEFFGQLAQKNPDDAIPLLYLGLVYQRMGQQSDGEKSLQSAYLKPNAEASIHRGRLRDPSSVPMRLAEGNYYLTFRKDYARAREIVLDTTRLDPESYGVWELLGKIEQLAKQYTQAIACYERAIECASRQSNVLAADEIRQFFIPQVLLEIDRNLIGLPDPPHLQRANELLLKVDQHIQYTTNVHEIKDISDDSASACDLNYIRGIWMSGTGFSLYLSHHEDQQGSLEYFRQAKHYFGEALAFADRETPVKDSSRPRVKYHIERGLAELVRRVRACKLEDKLKLAAKN